MTDQELVKGCLEGRREVQRALFEQYSRLMMTVCLRYTDDKDEAADVLQEGFIKVYEKIGQWNGTGALGGWIRTIMVNTALTHYRDRSKWNAKTDVEEAGGIASTAPDSLSDMNAEELMKLIHSMPTGYRTVFNLFAVEGYGHKEIADMLGITENTSKTQYLKARNWLQKALKKFEAPID